MVRTLRLAVAQSVVAEDPHDVEAVQQSGNLIRELMRRAHGEGARLVQFPEGAITYPSKYAVSSAGPGTVAAAAWSRVDWSLLRGEAEGIAGLAGDLGIWTAFGSVHPLSGSRRPRNSFYLVSDAGELVARYDKRFLSHTEVTHLYTPGTAPTVVTIDGIRFGVALCIEANFPELFAEYEQLEVDCVLLSVTGDYPIRATIAQSYAALFNYWVGYSVAAQHAASAPAGIVAPGGRWLARCPTGRQPDLAIADLDLDSEQDDIRIALQHARPWRRTARSGIYTDHLISGDPRDALTARF